MNNIPRYENGFVTMTLIGKIRWVKNGKRNKPDKTIDLIRFFLFIKTSFLHFFVRIKLLLFNFNIEYIFNIN